MKILKHKHESYTGRTSSITQYYIKNKDKIIGFIDLAGHEKYLKTTMSGLTGCLIDYAMVTVGGERGVIGMTKEHIAMAIGLQIPIFFVITKIDIAPEDKIDLIISKITKIMMSNAAGKKKIQIIRDKDNIDNLNNNWLKDNICPVFLISNKEGINLSNLRNFIYTLNSRKTWINKIQANNQNNNYNKVFRIDDVFNVKGVGIVLSGIVKQGIINVDDNLFIGPFHGQFNKIIIKSIDNNGRTKLKILILVQVVV